MKQDFSEKSKCILIYTASFLCSGLIFLLFCAGRGIYPFGENVLDNPDFIQQRVPFFYHLWDALHGRADLFFDWNYALGVNCFGSFTHFSVLSPFSFFSFFVRVIICSRQ